MKNINLQKLVGYLLMGFILLTMFTLGNIQKDINEINAITQSNSELGELNYQTINDMLKTK